MSLNLYLVEQTGDVGYDCYDSFVIACKSEEDARNCNPGADEWDFETIEVSFIGNAAKGIKEGIVISSFNAG